MSDHPDQAEIAHAVQACIASQRGLVTFLADAVAIDPTTPSGLPDWTVGHVLTHLARNADSIVSMLDGHDQYPHGVTGRNADIEAGAARDWSALVADVTGSSERVATRLSAVDDWSGTVTTVGGERPTVMVPQLRQREVEVHRRDLALGYDFADMPADFVRRDLRLMEMLWAARQPMGMTAMPDLALAVEPPQRLSWLMGRRDIDGVPPADVF